MQHDTCCGKVEKCWETLRKVAERVKKLIGDIIFDPAGNQVTVQGDVKLLEPRLARLLEELCAAGGEPVARDVLLAAVSTLPHAADDVLTQAISKLRQILGDDPKAPRFIKTVPRRGYALIAPIADYADSPKIAPSVPNKLPWMVAIGALILALLIFAYTAYRFSTREIEIEFHEKADQEFIEKESEGSGSVSENPDDQT